MRKRKRKKKTEDKPEEESLGFFDRVGLQDLYVCKGKRGIYLIHSMLRNKDTVVIVRYSDAFDEKGKTVFPVPVKNLLHITAFYFQTTRGSVFPIKAVFNNLHKYEESLEGDTTLDELDLKDKEIQKKLMEIAVPNYDPDKFKHYHLHKLIKWYRDLVEEIIILKQKEDKHKSKK